MQPIFNEQGDILFMGLIDNTLAKIATINSSNYKNVQKRLDQLTKPQGSLGRLEEAAARYVAIRGDANPGLTKKVIFTFAADHGVANEKVSAFPKEVTPQMVFNFLNGGAGVNVLAKHINAEVVVIDMGVDHDFGKIEGLINKKIRRGTSNMAEGPAMSRQEAITSIETGITLANEWASKGLDIAGTGDMGIGNTTPSAAIVSVITGKSVEEVTGRGTGIDEAGLGRKINIINQAISKNRPDKNDAVDVLSKVGGFEIGAIAGLILGCAANRIPTVVDGFISGAAALIACTLEPKVKEYLFLSHMSVEIGHEAICKHIDDTPYLNLKMRLGEGTGAALCINLIEASYKILTQMATFGEAGVSDKE
jgi:nicotinate-nucleotide--dimethylbenzimidazole phosphoribosyltransferase